MIEQFLELMREYPVGTQVQCGFDGHWEDDIVVGYRVSGDQVYLVMSERMVHIDRVKELIRKKQGK